MDDLVYFPVKYAIAQHDKIVDLTGGLTGMKDALQLESSLLFIKNDVYYPTFLDKLTHLVYSVAMNHCFNDANKRSSIVLGAYFLEINGRENLVPVFILEMENIVLWVANHFLDKKDLSGFIESILTKGGFDEEDKLRLASILSRVETENPKLLKSNTKSKVREYYDNGNRF